MMKPQDLMVLGVRRQGCKSHRQRIRCEGQNRTLRQDSASRSYKAS